jgi:hypothetical protein
VAGIGLVAAVTSPVAGQTLDKKVPSLDAARIVASAAEDSTPLQG